MSSNNHFKFSMTALALTATVAFAPTSSAALVTYTQDFEGMTPNQGFSDPDAVPPFVNDLDADGWQIYGIVYETNPYNNPSAIIAGQYGPFPAANGDPGSIQGVAEEQGGLPQGDVVLSKYTDYNNEPAMLAGQYVSASTYQEQTVGAGDVGSTWRFSYDAKMGNLEADSSAFAYILTQDFVNGGEAFSSNDSTNLPAEWNRYFVDLEISADMIGDNLTFGFGATAANYNGSGIFYDNLEFAEVSAVPVPAAVWLFGSGLLGLVGVARRRKH
ncbi:MAG: VPLPA-CTERM sorting domain-containing protein [Gammaproteobacteria bacterium]|nr:VPLPA-CTERM sorting domain-containing protein [Gammaproteobacteria bacterium]